MAAVAPTLRVASWNLHEGLPADADGSAPTADTSGEVAAFLLDNGVDIVGFQELDLDENGNSGILRRVVEQTPLRYTAVHRLSESSFFPGRFTGVALASRHPLTAVERRFLPNPHLSVGLGDTVIHSHDKGFVAATVLAPGAPLNAMSLHAVPFHLFRREADDRAFSAVWLTLTASLRTLARRPLVVCGDFNTENRRLVLGDGSPQLGAAMAGRATYRNLGLDDILHSPQLATESVKVLSNFSDHALCLAEFSWKEQGGHG